MKKSFLVVPFVVAPTVLVSITCSAQSSLVKKQVTNSAFVDAGLPFGTLRLVDEIDCGKATQGYEYNESPEAAQVQTLLGRPCRVLPNRGDAKHFAYRIGKGKGLKAGTRYVLSVEFPEDQARSLFISNRGADIQRGVRTGAAVGDAIYTYTNNNPESLKVPLSGKYRSWRMLFTLHDRMTDLELPRNPVKRTSTPEDGFWVIISQPKSASDPISAGAAVSRIRLYEVPTSAQLDQKLNLPPDGLPQRHIFWREEMGDGVIDRANESERAVKNSADWFEYKAQLMNFLGINTYAKDLLEFGHNQGWDSGANNDWYNAAQLPGLWENILDIATHHHLSVLPYYEYAGAVGQKGLGHQRRAVPLRGSGDFTHLAWLEKNNVDVTDPETLVDAKRLLDATIVRYKDRAKFIGAWFRPRPSMMPISFADATLVRFSNETNNGTLITREQLKSDEALRGLYYQWWFRKRHDFVVALRDYLRAQGLPESVLLFTADASESGRSLPNGEILVTDDKDTWDTLLKSPDHPNLKAVDYEASLSNEGQLKALTTPRGTWGQWEWQHSDPYSDPQNYKTTEGAMLTYSFNRNYTTGSTKAFDAFRTLSGLAAIYHYPLNENAMDKGIGYFVADTEYSGPFSMMPEARAVAYGDPRYLGYLASSSFNRGFPEYVRAFNAAYLALPAFPSQVVPKVTTDKEIVVREIKTPRSGTYYSVVNLGMQDKAKVKLSFPTKGKVFDAATDKPIGKVEVGIAMYPFELRSFVIR